MTTTPDALAKVSEADLQRLLRLLNESLLTAPNVRIPLMDAITELLRARERIKEMEKDAGRYRWLKASVDPGRIPWIIDEIVDGEGRILEDDAADSAIDAAIDAAQP